MRVVCIDDSDQNFDTLPSVKKGNIYTVMAEQESKGGHLKGDWYPPGIYYQLLETGNGVWFHNSAFISINEDQQDETQMEREYNTVKA